MATIQRPTKEGSVRTYQEKVGLGFVDILASEMDADLDTIYAAWNGGADTINIKDGAVTYAKLAADAKLWTDTGTALTPTNATRFLTVPGSTTAAQLVLGPSAAKGRVRAYPSGNYAVALTMNLTDAGGQDDAASPSWQTVLNCTGGGNDGTYWYRTPPGGAATNMLTLSSAGHLNLPVGRFVAQSATFYSVSGLTVDLSTNDPTSPNFNASLPSWLIRLQHSGGDAFTVNRRAVGQGTWNTMPLSVDATGNLIIAGGIGQKASGTTWSNPSDRRLKDEIEDYATGLAAVMQLQPRTFVYNGKGGSLAGQRGYGFIADEVAPVMPEMVGVRSGKLDPDDETETEIQTLDQSNLILALVNAVRELAARLTAVEAAA
jgi:Chaperone of endosialidase